MRRIIRPEALMMCGLLCALMGCADVKQVIHLDHNGAGKIVETVTVTPRGIRMLQGMAKRSGGALETPKLLSDEALQARVKAMGGVTLVGKKEKALPDGRKQLEITYTFTDVGKVNFYIVPTLNYNKMASDRKTNRTGKLVMEWKKGPFERFNRIYREAITIQNDTTHGFSPTKMATPADRQKFKRVLPIFLDMLKDFNLSIEVRAPIEDFEERDMIAGLPQEGNRVTVFKMSGAGVTSVPSAVLQAMMNEFTGHSLSQSQRAMPGVFTTIPARHHGYGMRFMKVEQKR